MAKAIFYLILFTFFINLYKRFTLPFSYISGTANIYLTPKLYAVDFLLIALALLTALTAGRNLTRANFLRFFPLTAFLVSVGLSVVFSQNPAYSLYFLARFVLSAVFFLTAFTFLSSSRELGRVGFILAFPVLIVSLLALLQWRSQRYILGFLPFGEPTFSGVFANSPLTNLAGAKYLRAFGTFPHPNVLGGFLAVSLIWIFDTFLKSFAKERRSLTSLFLFFVILLGLLALFLSFSQSAWAALVLGVLLYFLAGQLRRPGQYVFLFLASTLLVTSLMLIYYLPFDSPSSRRADLTGAAITVWRARPLTGVGPGNFVAASPYFWKEPVHNIYLLMLSETGLLGLASFLIFLLLCLKNALRTAVRFPLPLVVLAQVLFLGLFDHYLLTSSAGSLLFWLTLGFAVSRQKAIM